jgi:signal transduction histidine kinase
MTTEEKIKVIEKTTLFHSLTYTDFCQIAEVARVETFKSGDIIFEENAVADAFYIISHGEVEILKLSEDGNQEILATKKDGDVFGEMAVIDDLPRSATIKAKTDITLLQLSKNVFTELLKNFSHIAIEIARNIAYTVRTTNSNYIGDLESRNKQLEAAYRKLKKTQNELIRMEKLSVVGKFASLIIHDIKNPMSNIRAYAELIKMTRGDEDEDEEKLVKSCDIIVKEVDRLTHMTGELLEFARGEISLHPAPVNFSALIDTMIDTVTEDLKQRDIELVFTERDDSVVMLDSDKIQRVFSNLVNNAADALLTGGKIVIQLNKEGKWIKWSIQDTGIGMEPDVLSKIFEPFYTHGKKKGSGLGMAIVKSIIEAHKGTIKAFSRKDSGTRFDIYLPVA